MKHVTRERPGTVTESPELPCDHFNYFALRETAPRVAAWLRAQRGTG